MKNILAITLAFVLLMAVPVFAETEEIDLVKPGLAPDSAFYGFEKAFDGLNLAFTFNKEKKAQKALNIAEKRLAEVELMTERGTQKHIDVAEKEHEKAMNRVEGILEDIDLNGSLNASEDAMRKMSEFQLRIQEHAEKIEAVHNRILERKVAQGMDEEQVAHLEQVFAKIQARTQKAENNALNRQENARVGYKVHSGKTDAEVQEVVNQIQNKAQEETGINVREGIQNRVSGLTENIPTEEDEVLNEIESGLNRARV